MCLLAYLMMAKIRWDKRADRPHSFCIVIVLSWSINIFLSLYHSYNGIWLNLGLCGATSYMALLLEDAYYFAVGCNFLFIDAVDIDPVDDTGDPRFDN